MEKTKEELEKQKLQLEIEQLQKSNRQIGLQKWFSIIQVLSVVIGIGFALNEFVFKDREAHNNKIKATLDYVGRIADSTVVKAEDSLKTFRDLAYTMPVGDKREAGLFESFASRMPKATAALCEYYNTLQTGIENGYFDRNLAGAFLQYDSKANIEVLGELQSRHYGLNTKLIVPNYQKFKGLIEFYVTSYGITKESRLRVPQYDLNKPF